MGKQNDGQGMNKNGRSEENENRRKVMKTKMNGRSKRRIEDVMTNGEATRIPGRM